MNGRFGGRSFERFVEQQERDPEFKKKLDAAREHFREEARRVFGDDDDPPAAPVKEAEVSMSLSGGPVSRNDLPPGSPESMGDSAGFRTTSPVGRFVCRFLFEPVGFLAAIVAVWMNPLLRILGRQGFRIVAIDKKRLRVTLSLDAFRRSPSRGRSV